MKRKRRRTAAEKINGNGARPSIPATKTNREVAVTRPSLARLEGSPADLCELVAQAFENLPRSGSALDDPEGSRYIALSDTLASLLAAKLRRAANKLRSMSAG